MAQEDFLHAFSFRVGITGSGHGGDEGLAGGDGAFSEVTGLEINVEVTPLREGGYHDGARQLVGKTSSPVLVLKRGVTRDASFWTWIQHCIGGRYPLPYVDGIVEVFPSDGPQAVRGATWQFVRGIVTKVKTADLNAIGGSSVAIEELHIAHEGLARVTA